jgi:hypothetical protein
VVLRRTRTTALVLRRTNILVLRTVVIASSLSNSPNVIIESRRRGMQTRSRERTGAGGSFNLGGTKAEIRNAAATTSRCVGSEKVASRSGDRPAIIPSSPSTHHFGRAAHGEARCAGRFSRRHEATRYIREGERHLSRQERLLLSLKPRSWTITNGTNGEGHLGVI